MCYKLGRVIPVIQANKEEEIKARNNPPSFYCYYWRTRTGELRQTGYIKICACGKFQEWGKTKRELYEKQIERIIKR